MKTITFPLQQPSADKTISLPRLKLRQPAALAGFTDGQIVSLTVKERLGQGRYLVTVGGRPVEVESHLPLAAKARYEARLERGAGQTILRLQEGHRTQGLLKESLLFFLANPGGIGRSLQSLAGLLERLAASHPLPPMLRACVDALKGLLDSLPYTAKSCDDHAFVRDYLTRIGLFVEGEMRKFLEGRKAELPLQGGLKGRLIILLEEIEGLSAKSQELAGLLRQIGEQANEALRGIENLQALNVLLRQTDRVSFLPIPLSFPGGPGQGEIFISEQEKGPSGQSDLRRASIFLDMDILGPISIELSFAAGRLSCLCRCERELASRCINDELPSLAEALREAGYALEGLACRQQEDVEKEKRDFLAGLNLYQERGVDFFA